jgi:signal transduction histidine kinase
MRVLRVLGYALGALVLGAGWAFFYWQSQPVDIAAAAAARSALGALRGVDTRWNDQLVSARTSREAAAAALRAPVPHESAYAAFEVAGVQLPGYPAAAGLLALKRTLDEKSELVGRALAAQAELARLPAGLPADDPRRLELVSLSESRFHQAWLAPSGPRIEAAGRALDRALDDALARSELYRAWLMYYSAFLLTVLAYLAWSLAASRKQIERFNLQLRQANETLEQRVAERTHDLSEALRRLKESEAMLIQSEKMSSLGQMVAGIAHEVNTPLAYVRASLDTVASRLPAMSELAQETALLLELLGAESADEARLAAQFDRVRGLLEAQRGAEALREIETQLKDGLYGIGQIAEIVANLKNFSRIDRSKVAEYDLHDGIESTLRIAQNHLRNKELRKNFAADLPKVSCAPSQINQVFLNLISNAAQATPESGGVITVRTARRDPQHVAVEVIDNGQGIPEDVLPKIFDPFFTTKPVGKGTGLGLSICYKIVESHGGRLEVQTKRGVGTRFTVLLPVAPPAAKAA